MVGKTVLREKVKGAHDTINNVYAYDSDGQWIYILDAVSGKMGYYCPGCGLEQQAVKQHKRKKNGVLRKSFFRHSIIKNDAKEKCVYSDETYRHKLGKEILQQLMKVKVPAVYVTNPDNPKEAVKVRDSQFIYANKVTIEKDVYKDDDGVVRLGQGNGYIRPDVIFLSSAGRPILFIELVASHRIHADKLAKIKRIGIDTIQVKVPAKSPEEIEHDFMVSINTNWIYCNEKERTNYWELPITPGIGIQKIDGFKSDLTQFEKSFRCREAEIKLFIETVRTFMDRRRCGERIQAIRAEKEGVIEHINMVQDTIRREIESKYKIEEDIIRSKEEYIEGKYEEFKIQIGRKQNEVDRRRARVQHCYQIWREATVGFLRKKFIEKRREIEQNEARITRAFECYHAGRFEDAMNYFK